MSDLGSILDNGEVIKHHSCNTVLVMSLSVRDKAHRAKGLNTWPGCQATFKGRMWDLIVSVPDHCLTFNFTCVREFPGSNPGLCVLFIIIICIFVSFFTG